MGDFYLINTASILKCYLHAKCEAGTMGQAHWKKISPVASTPWLLNTRYLNK